MRMRLFTATAMALALSCGAALAQQEQQPMPQVQEAEPAPETVAALQQEFEAAMQELATVGQQFEAGVTEENAAQLGQQADDALTRLDAVFDRLQEGDLTPEMQAVVEDARTQIEEVRTALEAQEYEGIGQQIAELPEFQRPEEEQPQEPPAAGEQAPEQEQQQ